MADEIVEQQQVQEVAETVATATVEATWLHTRSVLRVIFIALAVAAGLWILYMLEGVILLVVLSIFFAYLISPLVELVRRPYTVRGRERTVPRWFAIGIVYLLIFGSLSITIYVLGPQIAKQIAEFTEKAPTHLITARGRVEPLNKLFQRFDIPPSARDAITEGTNRAVEGAKKYANDSSTDIIGYVTYIPWLVLIPILGFFLLKDADSFRNSALKMLPRGRLRWRGDEFFQDVNSTLAAYIRAQLTACLLIGVICTFGFWLIGVPYWLALGLLAGLLEFIPLAGPLAVVVVACLVASFASSGKALTVLLFLAVLRVVHDYAIYPRIIGQGIHLHPLAVVLAILCGEELAGLAGIFLAIPAVAIIAVTYRHWLEHKGSEGLVKDLLKPAEQPVAAAPLPDNGVPLSAAAPVVTPQPAPAANIVPR